MVRWPAPTYKVRARFRAPIDFVYSWCTDYGSNDAALEGEAYERRILKRTSRAVVYEDLEATDEGWFWSRHVVTLHPPNHWHSDSVGSHRAYSLDYRLRRTGPEATELVLTARRRPYGVGSANPARESWERSVAKSWKLFSKALESDWRRSGPRKA